MCPSMYVVFSVLWTLGGSFGCTLSAFGLHHGDGDAATADPPGGPTTEVLFRMAGLEVLADVDTDGDGVVDNHLPDALAAIDLVLPEQGFAVDPFNARLAETIDSRTPVFVDAVWSGAALELTVATGAFDEAGRAAPSPSGGGILGGSLEPSGHFRAGPGDLAIEVSIRDGDEPVPFGLLETDADGTIDTVGIVGTLHTLVSVQAVIDDVIAPSVPDEGWDLDRDGVLEPKSEVMDLVDQLAPLAADTTLADGSPAITAVLAFDGYGG